MSNVAQYRMQYAGKSIGWDVDSDGQVWNVGEGFEPLAETWTSAEELEEWANDPADPLVKVEV